MQQDTQHSNIYIPTWFILQPTPIFALTACCLLWREYSYPPQTSLGIITSISDPMQLIV
ncbi:hypothetical protein BJX99DRAFT_231381 [Aspergillus californicus]